MYTKFFYACTRKTVNYSRYAIRYFPWLCVNETVRRAAAAPRAGQLADIPFSSVGAEGGRGRESEPFGLSWWGFGRPKEGSHAGAGGHGAPIGLTPKVMDEPNFYLPNLLGVFVWYAWVSRTNCDVWSVFFLICRYSNVIMILCNMLQSIHKFVCIILTFNMVCFLWKLFNMGKCNASDRNARVSAKPVCKYARLFFDVCFVFGRNLVLTCI